MQGQRSQYNLPGNSGEGKVVDTRVLLSADTQLGKLVLDKDWGTNLLTSG